MFVKTLKSLVVRGVSVLSDGKAVSVRLGFGDLTTPQNPEIPISMRHGGCAETVAEPEGRRFPGYHPADAPASLRAGRSVSPAGVLYRRTSTSAQVTGQSQQPSCWRKRARRALPASRGQAGS